MFSVPRSRYAEHFIFQTLRMLDSSLEKPVTCESFKPLSAFKLVGSQLFMLLSFFSLENTLQVALGKCLGTAGTLRLPLVMPYRCIAPGEKESVTFTLKYNPSKGPQGKPCVLVD